MPSRYQHQLAFNSHRGPLKSPSVRKALNLAIDRTDLLKRVLHGSGDPATGPSVSEILGLRFNPAALSARSDRCRGTPGCRWLSGSTTTAIGAPNARLRFTCLLPQNFTVWERSRSRFREISSTSAWTCNSRSCRSTEFNQLVSTGQFEAVFLDMISGPTPARPYIWWRSAQKFKGQFNVFGYENPEAERLFEAASLAQTKQPFDRRLPNCKGSFTMTRLGYSSPGTHESAPSVGALTGPRMGGTQCGRCGNGTFGSPRKVR